MSMFKAAAIQMRSGTDPKRNAADLEKLVRDAASQGAIYIQTPEMTGAIVRDRDARNSLVTTEDRDPIVAASARLAAELGIFLHIGSTAILRADGKLANRALLFSPDGKIVTTYDKIHMFDVDLDNGESWRESAAYEPGREGVVADLPFAKLGFAICYDLRFPQLFRAEALAGADVLTVPAAFTRQTGEAHWHVLLRARAIENGCFVLAAAQGGKHENGRETYGHSLIVDPWGRILAEGGTEPGVVMGTLDLAEVAVARGRIPSLQHGRRFEITAPAAEPTHLHAIGGSA